MSKLNILLVEDDTIFSQCVKLKLEKFCQVSCESRYDSGVLAINNLDWDLIILDLKIQSDSDGLDLVKMCATKNLPTMVLSGSSDDKIKDKTLVLGAKKYFNKLDFDLGAFEYIQDMHIFALLKQFTLNELFFPLNTSSNQVFIFHIKDNNCIKRLVNELSNYNFQDSILKYIKDISDWNDILKLQKLEENKNKILFIGTQRKLPLDFDESFYTPLSWHYCDVEKLDSRKVDHVAF